MASSGGDNLQVKIATPPLWPSKDKDPPKAKSPNQSSNQNLIQEPCEFQIVGFYFHDFCKNIIFFKIRLMILIFLKKTLCNNSIIQPLLELNHIRVYFWVTKDWKRQIYVWVKEIFKDKPSKMYF